MKTKIFVLAVSALLAQGAFAAKTKAPVSAVTRDDFTRLAANVRAEMQPKGRYAEVGGKERSRVDALLDEMAVLFARSGEVANMRQSEKVALFNAQEEVNGILLKRDAERLICVTESRSGTHFKNTTCKTAREIDEEGKNSRGWFANSSMRIGSQMVDPEFAAKAPGIRYK